MQNESGDERALTLALVPIYPRSQVSDLVGDRDFFGMHLVTPRTLYLVLVHFIRPESHMASISR